MNYISSYALAFGLLSTMPSVALHMPSVAGAAPIRHADSGRSLGLNSPVRDAASGNTLGLNLEGDQESAGSCAGHEMSFEEFVQKFKRSYTLGSTEYEARKALFVERVEEARAHNCRPQTRFWKAGANSLSDRTKDELKRLRGRKGTGTGGQPSSGGIASGKWSLALESDENARLLSIPPLPDSFSWKHLKAMNQVFDQGACGSCWASATAVMLRAHTDIYQQHRNLSVQQLVSCVPNPEQCGGSGGCDGSTGELALDYVYHNGLETDEEIPYVDGEGGDYGFYKECPKHMIARNKNPAPQPQASSFLAVSPAESTEFASPAMNFGMTGWSRLPVNKLRPLYEALYQEGPVAVSIVAGYAWNAYVSGIMNACTIEDTVINHLVVLIGYGSHRLETADWQPLDTKYWQIQNSWGADWGEEGQIRMIRQDTDENEEKFCGWDDEPLVGTGCEGEPDKVFVCGSCGILYDSVVAHFKGDSDQAKEMLARRGETM